MRLSPWHAVLKMIKETLGLEPWPDRLREEHRKLILHRTKIGCWVAAPIVPVTVFLYNSSFFPDKLTAGMVVGGLVGCFIFLLQFTTRLRFIQKHYEAPLALLLLAAMLAATVNMQLTDGAAGYFYFPYFLLFIGMAIYFPASLRWVFMVAVAVVVSYIGSEWWAGRDLHSPRFLSNLIYLVDAALIGVVGNRLIYQLFIRDKQNQIKLEQANEKLQELDQAKSFFFANISHELKTPISLIVNLIEGGLNRLQGAGVQLNAEQAEVVCRNAYRLATMITDLIEISREEIDKRQLTPVRVEEVGAYVGDFARAMIPLFWEKGVGFEIDISRSLAPHDFDVQKIDKVLFNLLSNALKFTSRGGRAKLAVRDAERGRPMPDLEIQVSDTGIGISEDKLPHIFERFMQVEAGTTRSFEGMGIGLFLVKDIVEQHGGAIEATSIPAQGSSFTVFLPRGREFFTVPALVGVADAPISEMRLDFTRVLLRKESLKDASAKSHEEETDIWPSSPSNKMVLIVDDNPEMLHVMGQLLSPDYNVLTSRNGQEALRRLRQDQIHLVLCDMMMPLMDGCQLAREIRSDHRLKNTPIIFVTAKSDKEGLLEAFEAGGNDYLSKPFSAQELKLRVRNQILIRELLDAEMLRQQNLVSLGTLSSGISHDMNNYAGRIQASVASMKTLFRTEMLTEEEKKKSNQLWDIMERSLQSMVRMIRSLTMYSQKNVDQFKEEDIVQTTRSVVDLARIKLPKNVSLEYKAPMSLACHFNPHLLNPAILNLIENAFHACQKQESGLVEVSLANEGDAVTLKVRDNGSGIPAEIHNRIWEPYFTTKGIEHGTGLGLWMVRRAVETEHGGKIWFETGPSGTVFVIRLH